MTVPLGILLGLIAAIFIAYPFFRSRAKSVSGDEALDEELEKRIRALRKGRSEAAEDVVDKVCPSCGARCDSRDKFCSECGASLST
ncbi:MAG TPA: zinc-ribbon domain-containing protein [Dehalococcoidia bacterium]|nr:zinc-ribbon domain-containing protein [Dehalococcoidia bacterium]